MPPVIETRALTKTYGAHRGVEDLTLSIERGQIYGYLGPNGAGKTTTIRLMLDFVRPSGGEIRILGETPKRGRHLRRRIGYLPGELGLYEESTGLQSLNLYAGLSSAGYAPLREWACDALQLSQADLRRRIRHYSKGMKQKLGIVQAIQHDPDLLILDEPTGGLDPVVQARFFEVLREFRRRGRTVFFSSHILSEVEAVCDRVGVLREGKLVLDSEMAELTAKTDRLLYLRPAGPAVPAPPAVAPAEGEGQTAVAVESPEAGVAAEPTVPAAAAASAATPGQVVMAPPRPVGEGEAEHPPQIPGARFFRREGEWLVYAVSPRDIPDLLQALAVMRPVDFRLESALGESFLQLYGVGGLTR